jgi:hypothetical protein
MEPVRIDQRGKLGNAGREFGPVTPLRKELRDGYLRENDLNLQLANEWFHLDAEAWQTLDEE